MDLPRNRPSAPQASPQASPQGSLVALAERRLGWLDRRQAVLAQNVAHADTPGYRPRDVVSFRQHLAGQLGAPMARTQPGHLGPSRPAQAGSQPDRAVPEAAPDGNAVSLDREAVRIAETDTAHALAMAVHRSFTGMFRLTLGRGG